MFRTIALMIMAVFAASAMPGQARIFGEWNTLDLSDPQARTSNGAGSAFSFACLSKDCLYSVESRKPCTERQKFAAVVSSKAGRASLSLMCHIVDDHYILLAWNVDLRTMFVGDYIEFTIPAAGGVPEILRFSLDGANDAVSWVINRKNRPAGDELEDKIM